MLRADREIDAIKEHGTADRIVKRMRILCAEMVQRANSGHPGAPMGLAPLGYVLFSKVLRISTNAPRWADRDVIILSNGHACALLYASLHFLGAMAMEDLKSFRQLGSRTPGHPEFGGFVDATTGPLGQGIGQAVGYAIAKKRMERFNREGHALFKSHVFCLVGDGCMQEGVSMESLSLAGHLSLNNITFIYDSNKVTIDGPTSLSVSENVEMKVAAMGIDVETIEDDEDIQRIEEALRARGSRPRMIVLKTIIGKGSKQEGTAKVHGSPLGAEDIQNMKKKWGFPEEEFLVEEEVYRIYKTHAATVRRECEEWHRQLEAYSEAFPEEFKILNRNNFLSQGDIDDISELGLPRNISAEGISTREHLHKILNAWGPLIPNLVGGSGDLTPSTLTKWDGSKNVEAGNFAGEYLRFGIREHAMFAIVNGIAEHGWHIPFGSTFLNFVTYGFPALRIGALSKIQSIVFATHDSIALGEDGPTHQPIETLALLRATPNITVLRPCDGVETEASVLYALSRKAGPTVISLTRQKIPKVEGTSGIGLLRGAYILRDYPIAGGRRNRVVLMATGSEVSLCCSVIEDVEKGGHFLVKVVSFPSMEIFDLQEEEYKRRVLEGDVTISVEALSTFGWRKYAGHNFGMDVFGASAPGPKVYEHFGFTPENLCNFINRASSASTD